MVLLVVLISCSEDIPDSPLANQTPQTFLWLFPDTSVGVSVSRQHLRWWGEDPDGVIKGYLFAFGVFSSQVTSIPNPDTLRYSWLTKNDTLIAFPLDTQFRNYTVFVRSVDNTFQGLPEQSIVRFSQGPFWDKNDNGMLDAEDATLPDLLSAVDPRGAILTFPIRNTPPTLAFAPNPDDPSRTIKQPDTTFTAATFSWKGFDFDGDNTLASYRIALNDTSDPSRWVPIPIRDTVITLVVPRARSDSAAAVGSDTVTADLYSGKFLGRQFLGRIRGLQLDALNVLYAQVQDVAGEFSPVITMPSGTDHWYVKRPRGKLLLVSDYIGLGPETALATYFTSLAAVPGGQFAADSVDNIDIGRGLDATTKRFGTPGDLVPLFIDPALINTFLLYDYVVWYTEQFPSLAVAQLTLFTYLQNGGKVLFSTTFESSVDARGALNDFAPIDSISSVPFTPRPAPGDTRIPADFVVFADRSDTTNIYPQLAFNSAPVNHVIFMRPIYRRSDSRYIYHLQEDTRGRYIGMPNVAVVDGQGTIVFVGLPLHLLNKPTLENPLGLTAFFMKIFTEEFDLLHQVDRRKF